MGWRLISAILLWMPVKTLQTLLLMLEMLLVIGQRMLAIGSVMQAKMQAIGCAVSLIDESHIKACVITGTCDPMKVIAIGSWPTCQVSLSVTFIFRFFARAQCL